jgi:hypothetical protein
MNTNDLFIDAFRTLTITKEIEDIDMGMLLATVSKTKQTFYYHFRDIGDLVAAIYLKKPLDGIEKIKTVRELLAKLFAYLQSDAHFNLRVLNNGSTSDVLVDLLFTATYTTLLRINKASYNKTYQNDANFFYAMGITSIVTHYFETKEVITNEDFDTIIAILKMKIVFDNE